LACAIERAGTAQKNIKQPRHVFWDEIAPGSGLVDGDGARVVVDEKDWCELQRLPTPEDKCRAVADLIRRQHVGAHVPIWQHAIESKVPPPLTEETALILQHSKRGVCAEDIAMKWHKGTLTQEQYLDKLLVVLWDALFFAQCRRWTKRTVANLKSDEVPQIGRHFLMGVDVGSEPIFNGLCSMCATLLHGNHRDQTGNSNWKPGPPMDRHGEPLRTAGGGPNTHDAQPPCFLRFSPKLFADEAPEMFEWEEATNKLKLKAGRDEPWIMHVAVPGEPNATWKYCSPCYGRWVKKSNKAFITYRDKASQHNLRPSWRELVRNQKRKADEMESSSQSQSQDQTTEPGANAAAQLLGLDENEGGIRCLPPTARPSIARSRTQTANMTMPWTYHWRTPLRHCWMASGKRAAKTSLSYQSPLRKSGRL